MNTELEVRREAFRHAVEGLRRVEKLADQMGAELRKLEGDLDRINGEPSPVSSAVELFGHAVWELGENVPQSVRLLLAEAEAEEHAAKGAA